MERLRAFSWFRINRRFLAESWFQRVLPFDYLRIVCSFILAMVWFAEVPRYRSFAGAAVIIATSVYLLRSARRKAPDQVRAGRGLSVSPGGAPFLNTGVGNGLIISQRGPVILAVPRLKESRFAVFWGVDNLGAALFMIRGAGWPSFEP